MAVPTRERGNEDFPGHEAFDFETGELFPACSLMEAKDRNQALLEDGTGHRADEKLAQHRLSVGTHHEQARAQALYFLEDGSGRLAFCLQDVGNGIDRVAFQECDGAVGACAASRRSVSTATTWTCAPLPSPDDSKARSTRDA